MFNVLSLGLQGLAASVLLPWIAQWLKPHWMKGKTAAWGVWAFCCAVSAVYLVVTKQVPSVVWADPAAATAAVVGFGSGITALARQWYELVENAVKKVPSVWG